MKECPKCKQVFKQNTSRQVYCSHECSAKEDVICERCGTEFERYKNTTVPYCSKNCRNIVKGRTLLVECATCGKKHYKARSFVERSNRNYCSEECQKVGYTERFERTCIKCGKNFEVIASYKETQIYCSHECRRVNIEPDILNELYTVQKMSAEQAGINLGVSESNVFKHLNKFDIPIRSNSTGFGTITECLDGTVVKSSLEAIVANKLIENGIEYKYDCKLPFGTAHQTDFLVGDVYIEVWGMYGVEKYDQNILFKRSKYKEFSLKLVDIYPEDFKDIDKKIEEIKHLLK